MIFSRGEHPLVLGVDPSSSCSGYGYVHEGEVIDKGYFVCRGPKDKNDRQTTAENMVRFHHLLRRGRTPDIVVVEEVSVTMGMHTVRMLAYSEAVPIMYAFEVGAILVMVKATSVRRVVWGKGGISKAEACELMVQRYPDWDWPRVERKRKGFEVGDIDPDGYAGDLSDGCQLALAGETLARERGLI